MLASTPLPLGRAILDATIFGVTGIALLIVGYYIWELVTPYNLRHELQDNKNLHDRFHDRFHDNTTTTTGSDLVGDAGVLIRT